MRELVQRKDALVAQRACPPYFLKVSWVKLCAWPRSSS